MAFKIYTSSNIDLLTGKLAENISASKNIFIPDYIVTSNSGINNWIKIQLAEKNKIASNLRFIRNDDLIDVAYSVLNEKENNFKTLSSSTLLWLIFAELGSAFFKNKFAEVATYCEGDVLKQHGLALKLTKLFEAYQIYIFDSFNDDATNEFQRYIWQQVKQQIKGHYLTKNAIQTRIFEFLETKVAQDLLKEKLPNIHIFLGVDVTQYQLTIFKKLSEYTNISYYLFNPFSAKGTQNNLVENWGNLLYKLGLNLEKSEILKEKKIFVKPEYLLHKIQNDIFNNSPSEDRNKISVQDLNDNSITINNCYTTTREVEVLYNYLIKTISESNGKLGARDILVQAPNIDDYSAEINTVFSFAPIKLPFSISDKSYATTDSVYNAVEALLSLDDKYKAENIIQLLEFSSIRDKFEIDDIDLVRSLVSEANIRFGATGNEAIETDTVSWVYGLNRLIYGFCIGGEEYYKLENLSTKNQGYLIDIVEGAAATQLINLHYFFNKIVEWVEQLKASKKIEDWHVSIDNLINDFIASDKNDEISILKNHLSKLSELGEHLVENVDFRVVKEFVMSILSEQQSRSSFASKGITFCSMTQMRNIPYKIVVVLGANLNTFPRKDKEVSYNLMLGVNINKPTLKEQDKYLFLQLLMSVKQKLYISYIGKDTKTNMEIPPSSIVDDLCDYIYEGIADYNEADSGLITQHPLHGFSSKYNSNNDTLFSYLLTNSLVENKREEGAVIEDERESTEIEITDFINFFKNPFKYFYNKTLGIYYNEGQELLGDTELFELDNLQKWLLKSKLIANNEEALESFRKELVVKGELPLKNMGAFVLEGVFEDIQEMKHKFEAEKGIVDENSVEINLPLGRKTLVGKISNIYGDKFVFPCVSKSSSNFKYIIEYQIKRIILAAVGEILSPTFISVDGINDGIINNQNIPKADAVKKLKKLHEFYKYGQDKILPFTGEFDHTFMKKMISEDIEGVNKLLNEKVNPSFGDNFTSVPFVKEFNYGFFDDEKLEELKENTQEIVANILGIAL